MAHDRIDPSRIRVQPLQRRKSFIDIRTAAIDPAAPPPDAGPVGPQVHRLAQAIVAARTAGASVMLTYGAHLIKNGCGPLVNAMIEGGWITHLATQGAGIIHDWEFAHLGRSSESVRDNAPKGEFGTWDETGRAIITAALNGAKSSDGFGQALGRYIHDHTAQHPHRRYSVTACAFEHDAPLCVLPGVGYDIYCCHPMFTEDAGAALGRCATRDFHAFCHGVGRLCTDKGTGVYLSIGSAVMSPQVFEKAISIANNLRLGAGKPALRDFLMAVVDIQDGGGWDWTKAEPPEDHPAYYLRFCKSFYRMGGKVDYIQADNRAALANLAHELKQHSTNHSNH